MEERDPDTQSLRDVRARFARYWEAVSDFDSFVEALAEPQPTCISANTIRVTVDELDALFREEGRGVDPVGWYRGGWRVPASSRPGLWWQFRAGLIHVQEEASLLPVVALDLAPGHRVLDLCAAPGGKTALIAMRLGNRGTIIANDRNSYRLAALRDVNKRLGLLNVTATVHDGGEIPSEAGTFDRILVDAPCSSEGTRWHERASYADSPQRFRDRLRRTQHRLLECAVARCRPGGRVVYSTCSFAPEENEAVVDRVLRHHPVRVVPLEFPGLSTAPGLVAFESRAFDSTLAQAVRLWPHVSGTGGFFVVALQKEGDGAAILPHEEASRRPAPGAEDQVRRLCERFGFDDHVFSGLKYFGKSDQIHAFDAQHVAGADPTPVTGGLMILRSHDRPATPAALHFGRHARRRVVELDRPRAEAFQRRVHLDVSAAELIGCETDGLVIVRHRGYPLGVGLVVIHGERASLTSEFPKAWVSGEDPDSVSSRAER